MFKSYKIYECPENPIEYGKYIGKTPILEQAIEACKKAKVYGKSYCIKGVKTDETEVIFL